MLFLLFKWVIFFIFKENQLFCSSNEPVFFLKLESDILKQIFHDNHLAFCNIISLILSQGTIFIGYILASQGNLFPTVRRMFRSIFSKALKECLVCRSSNTLSAFRLVYFRVKFVHPGLNYNKLKSVRYRMISIKHSEKNTIISNVFDSTILFVLFLFVSKYVFRFCSRNS